MLVEAATGALCPHTEPHSRAVLFPSGLDSVSDAAHFSLQAAEEYPIALILPL